MKCGKKWSYKRHEKWGTLQNLADFDNKSLLIVDDNPLRCLSRAMEKKGFQVIQTEGVKE